MALCFLKYTIPGKIASHTCRTQAVSTMRPLCALGGGALGGTDLTHFAYLDEAGISGGDRVAVVAGVIVESRRALSIQNHMRLALGQLLTETPLPDDFAISAKDLFHGTRSFKDEKEWPADRRFEMLNTILRLPSLFHMTALVGWYRRDPEEEKVMEGRKRLILAHARAFQMAAIPVERYMREEASWDSVATMVLEKNTDTREAVRNMQRKLRSQLYVSERVDPQLHEYLPLTRVLEDPMFVEKPWSNLMLLADACSFSLSRWYHGHHGADDLLEKLLGQMRPTFPPEHQAGQETFRLSFV